MSLKVVIRGAARTGRVLRTARERLEVAHNVAQGMGEVLVEEIKERHLSGQTVRQRTGALRESWTVFGFNVPKPTAIVASNATYAAFVNYRRYPGKPPTLFLQKAFRESREKMMAHAREAFGFGR